MGNPAATAKSGERRISLFNPYSAQMANYHAWPLPIGLAAIAHETAKRGWETKIYDNRQQGTTQIIKHMHEFQPSVVGISTFFRGDSFAQEKAVAETFRGKALIVVGGPDASTNKFVRQELEPDFIVVGEGELAMSELARANFNPDKLDRTKVGFYKEGKTWIVTAKQAYNLDDLPLAHEIAIDAILQGGKFLEAVIDIARGCVGSCSFCTGGGKKPIYMSPRRVVEQILSWLPFLYTNSTIHLLAPDITALPNETNRVIAAINSHPEINHRKYGLAVRADTAARATDGNGLAIWERFLRENTVELEVGLESPCPEVLSGPLHKTRDPLKYLAGFNRLVDLTRKTNTQLGIDLVVFQPDFTLEQLIYTYTFLLDIIRNNPHVTIYKDALLRELILYPCTQAAQMYTRNGFNLAPNVKSIPLKPFMDQRVAALKNAFRFHHESIVGTKYTNLDIALSRILFLAKRVAAKHPLAHMAPSQKFIDTVVEYILENRDP